MSDSALALSYKSSIDLRLTSLWPAARVAGEALMWLGGGVLFAATVFLMVALPGLLD